MELGRNFSLYFLKPYKVLKIVHKNTRAGLAAQLMTDHLEHIQTDVNLDAKPGTPINLNTLFKKTTPETI